jgi:hypothetical protein
MSTFFCKKFLSSSRIASYLSLNSLDILFKFPVHASYLCEVLPHLAKRLKIRYFIDLPRKELLRVVFDICRLFGPVLVVGDPTPVFECVVHGELLLQVPYLLLVALYHQVLVQGHVHDRLVRDSHHACRELQGTDGLLDVRGFRPDVGQHHGLAVATERVSEQVGQS